MCELDIIFNFEKAYFILDEFLLGGEVQETSKKNVLKAIEQADLLQEVSWEFSRHWHAFLLLLGSVSHLLSSLHGFRNDSEACSACNVCVQFIDWNVSVMSTPLSMDGSFTLEMVCHY